MDRRTLTRLALAVATATTLAACGGTDAADVAAPGQSTPPSAPATEPAATDPATSEEAPADAEEPGTEAPAQTEDDRTADFTVRPEGPELALVGGDSIEVLYTLPDEGESVFRTAAVRPGSTRDDLTVVVVTSAEGFYDLRWLEVTDGEVGELELFPEAYQLPNDLVERTDLAPVPVWSPDGASVAWVIAGEGDGAPTLQTIGWSDGPGTGDTADDNAAFTLDGVPADAQARDWTTSGDDLVLRVEATDGGAYDVVLERQADGALALRSIDAA